MKFSFEAHYLANKQPRNRTIASATNTSYNYPESGYRAARQGLPRHPRVDLKDNIQTLFNYAKVESIMNIYNYIVLGNDPQTDMPRASSKRHSR